MFHSQNSEISGSLILNQNNDVAFFYGIPLDFAPEWASIDIERGEIFIGGNEDVEGVAFKLKEMNNSIYEDVVKKDKLLLVQFEGSIEKLVSSANVPLSIANQASNLYDD